MRHASFFNGIGGFMLAAEWMGWENVFSVEIDKWCNKVSKKNFPNVKQYEDIKKTDFNIHKGAIDILTGGFPCQPFSTAGKRTGTEDDRYLWPEMLRAIQEIQPRWVVGENVYGLVNWDGGLVFQQIETDLETEGYEIIPIILPACGVGAWHRRDRIWIIAYSMLFGGARIGQYNREDIFRTGTEKRNIKENDVSNPIGFNDDRTGYGASSFCGERSKKTKIQGCPDVPNTSEQRFQNRGRTQVGKSGEEPKPERQDCNGGGWWESKPGVCGMANDVPKRMDEYINDYEKKEERPDEILPELRDRNDPEKTQRENGRSGSLPKKDFLQPRMYGKSYEAGEPFLSDKLNTSTEISQTKLRNLWGQSTFKHTPYRPGLDQQFDRELNDIVCQLSHEVTLEEWKDYAEETIGLQNLREAIQEIGYVSKTLPKIQKAWKSMSNEEKDWIIIRIGTGDKCWAEWPHIPRVATGVKDRVNKLKGLGNAIVPQVAYEIFKVIQQIEDQ